MTRRLRLASGLVLFAYVASHLLNHSFGLISLTALEDARELFLLVWRFLPISLLLYAALLTHMALAFWAIYRRRGILMPPWEAAQLLLGLAIPLQLTIHVLGTRLAHELYGLNDSYLYLNLLYWQPDASGAIRQALLLLVAWIHGCIGLHFWLRLKPGYERWAAIGLGSAVALPLLALAGFWVSGRDVLDLAENPAWVEAVAAEARTPSAAQIETIYALEDAILLGLAALLAATLAARAVRLWMERRRGLVKLRYPNDRTITVSRGTSILEASREAGIPHASVCGGRGRCSTCRVRIIEGGDHLPPPSEQEIRVLRRVNAGANVRLACQTRPSHDLSLVPLLPPSAGPRDARPRSGLLAGQEREVAILFADLRGFTSLAEEKLPYDVVFILNRYFRGVGEAVERAGGRVDKFIGDGVMALFGLRDGPKQGARQALLAAKLIAESLDSLNRELGHDLSRPLRIGIGIHIGSVIVGEMGYAAATSLTAIGDPVNTASRLESLTKDESAQLIVSEPLAEQAGIDLSGFRREEIALRGRAQRLTVRVIDEARNLDLTDLAGASSAA